MGGWEEAEMNWTEDTLHPRVGDVHLLLDDVEDCRAFVVKTDDGFRATFGGGSIYHYTHDTLQEAKDWCVAELWKRRLK